MKHTKQGIKRKGSKRQPVQVPEELKGREYLYALGRRKTSRAQVRIYKNGKGTMFVNGIPLEKYFTEVAARDAVKSPLVAVGQDSKVDVSAVVSGGGKMGQAESVVLGIARALIELNPTFRANLKKSGFLTRDPRAKERKKPGLKRARRSPQWSKR